MIDLTLSTLSIYAITLVLSSYSGPFHVFSLMRNKSPEMLKELLECFVCLSFYIAILFAVDITATYPTPDVMRLNIGFDFLEYLGMVGAAILLWKVSDR